MCQVLCHFCCVQLCNPVYYSMPVSSVHGVLQVGILECIAMSSASGSSQSRNWICISLCLLHWQGGSLPSSRAEQSYMPATSPVKLLSASEMWPAQLTCYLSIKYTSDIENWFQYFFRYWKNWNFFFLTIYYMSKWRRKWQPTPVFLPGKSHRQRSLVCYSPWGHKGLGTTEQLTHTHTLK